MLSYFFNLLLENEVIAAAQATGLALIIHQNQSSAGADVAEDCARTVIIFKLRIEQKQNFSVYVRHEVCSEIAVKGIGVKTVKRRLVHGITIISSRFNIAVKERAKVFRLHVKANVEGQMIGI